jgi:hypothetical protein
MPFIEKQQTWLLYQFFASNHKIFFCPRAFFILLFLNVVQNIQFIQFIYGASYVNVLQLLMFAGYTIFMNMSLHNS